MLQRILQRAAGQSSVHTAAVSRPVGRLLKVFVGDLEVVLGRHRLAVADPSADDVQRVQLGQFGFARAAKVLPEFWPRLQAGSFDDPHQLRAQIDRLSPVARDDELGAFLGLLKDLAQVREQLREKRQHSRLAAGMVFCLGAEELLGDAAAPADRVVGEAAANEP